MKYLYICEDGHDSEESQPDLMLCRCGIRMRRNYKRENVSVGIVPGGYKSTSTSYFDKDELRESGIDLSREYVEDQRSDALKAINEFTRDSEA